MKVIEHKNIAIVGGGPGGLTIGRLLKMPGANVKVYERDAGEHVHVQGATLYLHKECGLKALQEAGLIDAFPKSYRPGADRMRITGKNATTTLSQTDIMHSADALKEMLAMFNGENIR